MKRKVFTKEFKLRALELLESSKKTLRQVSVELGISESNLYNWRKEFQTKQGEAFPNKPQLDERELELRHLKARVAELEEEREILKKAAAFFARESQQSTR